MRGLSILLTVVMAFAMAIPCLHTEENSAREIVSNCTSPDCQDHVPSQHACPDCIDAPCLDAKDLRLPTAFSGPAHLADVTTCRLARKDRPPRLAALSHAFFPQRPGLLQLDTIRLLI